MSCFVRALAELLGEKAGVDQRPGSGGDFVEFMNGANKLGIEVIIDLVVNHTSDQRR
jgi:glycosidase